MSQTYCIEQFLFSPTFILMYVYASSLACLRTLLIFRDLRHASFEVFRKSRAKAWLRASLLLLVFSSLPQYGFAGVLLKAFWVWGCRVRVEGLDLGLWGFISRGSDHRPQGLRVESYNVQFRP